MLLAVASIIVAISCATDPRENFVSSFAIQDWPWYEDSYFNIKFQYPPNWKVEKIDVTDYFDESSLNLMGESAAVAGPDKTKSWIIRIKPPYMDIQEVNRSNVDIVKSAIIINQPNRISGNNHFYSDVWRSKEREYESLLDSYDENFRFNFTSHAISADENATTSISFGHSLDGAIAGITAVKRLPLNYKFQSYMTMNERLGRTGENIFVFMEVISSMRLLFPARAYQEENFKIPVIPTEYKIRTL